MTKLVLACTVAFGLSLGIATGAVVSRDGRSASSMSNSADSATLAKDSLLAGIDSNSSTVAATLDSMGLLDSANSINSVNRASAGPNTDIDMNSINAVTPGSKSGLGASATPDASSDSKGASDLGGKGHAALSARASKGATDSPESALLTRIAGIFAAMPTKDAARVLSEMDNADLQRILLSLPRKQQAAILGSLSTERAATIAKATLRDTL